MTVNSEGTNKDVVVVVVVVVVSFITFFPLSVFKCSTSVILFPHLTLLFKSFTILIYYHKPGA